MCVAPKEHHDGAVHGAELVVELGRDHAAGRIGLAEQSAEKGQWLAGVRVLPANQDDECEPHQQEEHAGEAVLKTDDLVIGGKIRRSTCPRILSMRRT